jgi:hypothetical protein
MSRTTSPIPLQHVIGRLAELYSPDETHLWLHTNHPLLGAKPINRILEGTIDDVLAVIEGLDASEYA